MRVPIVAVAALTLTGLAPSQTQTVQAPPALTYVEQLITSGYEVKAMAAFGDVVLILQKGTSAYYCLGSLHGTTDVGTQAGRITSARCALVAQK